PDSSPAFSIARSPTDVAGLQSMQVQHAAISTLSPDTSRRLARLGWIVTISVMLVLGYLSPVQDYSIVLLGCVMLLLSVWPALQWAERVRPWFPVFEI